MKKILLIIVVVLIGFGCGNEEQPSKFKPNGNIKIDNELFKDIIDSNSNSMLDYYSDIKIKINCEIPNIYYDYDIRGPLTFFNLYNDNKLIIKDLCSPPSFKDTNFIINYNNKEISITLGCNMIYKTILRDSSLNKNTFKYEYYSKYASDYLDIYFNSSKKDLTFEEYKLLVKQIINNNKYSISYDINP